MKRVKKQRRSYNGQERRTVAALDRLAAFEQFQEEILPALRQDLAAGKTAEELYKKYSALAAARSISVALGEADSAKAIAAVKDILDRDQGRAMERKQAEHKFAKVPDKELDAYLLTQLDELDTDSIDEKE